ncbi:MAG: hypothetical protein ACLVJO_11065 [[Clostridium] scindens]
MEAADKEGLSTQIVIVGRRIIPARPTGTWLGSGWRNL